MKHPYEFRQKSTAELSERRMRFSLDHPYEGPYESLDDAIEWANKVNESRLYSDFVFCVFSDEDGWNVTQDYRQ